MIMILVTHVIDDICWCFFHFQLILWVVEEINRVFTRNCGKIMFLRHFRKSSRLKVCKTQLRGLWGAMNSQAGLGEVPVENFRGFCFEKISMSAICRTFSMCQNYV